MRDVFTNVTNWALRRLKTGIAGRRRKNPAPAPPGTSPTPVAARRTPCPKGSEGNAIVNEMLENGRYTLLLRPQVIRNLDEHHLRWTLAELQDHMALVPKGQVVLGQTGDEPDDDASAESPHDPGRIVDVDPVFLDRYPVTNAQFQQFVDGGGYEQMAIWDEQILPAMLDFVDRSGHPGPRFWKGGRFLAGEENHPVVGIGWYEACAYGRWVGKRLPSDAEWCKAASWPVSISPGAWLQRKFPWGNAFEAHRANTWMSGQAGTEPVDQHSEGMSVGGVYQLIGNVWEWISGAYGRSDDASLSLAVPMKSVRGGAFDTYFENEATCQFQSGENPLSRKHNIGFRLALGACDLAPEAVSLLLEGAPPPEEPEPAEEMTV